MQADTGPTENAEQSQVPAPPTGWRWDIDEDDTPIALEYPPGLEKVAKAFEWFFDGLPHRDREAATSFLASWRSHLDEYGPNYSLSTNSAGGIRLDMDTVELGSLFNHFEPIVMSNALFEEVISTYQDFAENDDRFE